MPLVDVTNAPGVKPGDVATVVGRDGELRIPLEEQSSKAGQIPYALVCSLGAHLRREVSARPALRFVA